jgi:hypothetical protein
VIATEGVQVHQAAIAGYYGDLRAMLRERRLDEAMAQLEQAPKLGIRPVDLIEGLVQPLIYRLLGLSPSMPTNFEYERRFVVQVTTLLERLAMTYPELHRYRNIDKPVVLLLSVPSDVSMLGVRVIELGLASRLVTSKVVVQGHGLAEVMEQLQRHAPAIAGFFALSEGQLDQIERLAAGLRANAVLPKFAFLVYEVVTRERCVDDRQCGLIRCRNAMDIVRLIESN